MQPQQPWDGKKRIFAVLAASVVAIVMMGSFFWPILKDFYHARQNAKSASNAPLLIFGGFFLVMILAVVFSVVRGIRKLSKPGSAVQPPRDPKPWLARADWAAGKIKSSANANAKFFWLWSIGALAVSAPAVWHIPQEWQKGNHLILVALLFPIAAFYLIGYSIVKWRARRRFGDCYFELAQIPAPLGGTLEGMIQTGARLKLENGLHLKLSCIRRTVGGSGDNRNVQENILWQDEKILAPNASLPEPEPGQTGIPVHFKLPGNQPESYSRGNETVCWRLDAKAKMSGPSFHATFDVPVFKVAGAIVETGDEPDPTAALQEPVDEIRRDEHSKIRVSDGPNGREFYFPAARNLGTAFGLTLFFLAWTGFTLAAYFLFKSLFFEIVFTAVDVLIFLLCINLWLKSSRVTIDSTGVRVTKRWLLLSRSRAFSASDVVRFDTSSGMQSGSQIFWNIKLIKRSNAGSFEANKEKFEQTGQRPPLKFSISSPGGFTLASGIASAAEANWLVAEMNKALGHK